MTHHHAHPDQEPWHDLPEGFIDYLDLESRLNEPMRQAALEQAALALDAQPSIIVDLGSGTGADAIALAQHFPASRVHALDVSTELLDCVASNAAISGLNDRIKGHRVDLNEDWSNEIGHEVDLVWASLSLHHLDDPAVALQQVLNNLRPGGVLVMTEKIDQGVSALTSLDDERSSSQNRMVQAPSTPSTHETFDWSKLLHQAGFTSIKCHQLESAARVDRGVWIAVR